MKLRYTTIHHDVREKFGLTPSDYMVCDSIHQLSYRYPTTRSNRDIAEFLGVDHKTVGRAKAKLEELGLIEKVGDGLKTTELWYESVVVKRGEYSPAGEKLPKSGENLPTTPLYNKYNKKGVTKVTPPSEEIREVRESEDGEEKVIKKRDTRALRLRDWCYQQIEKEYGVKPLPSLADYKRLQVALEVISESDIKVMMEDALEGGKGRTVRSVFTNREIDLYRQENL